MARVLTLPTPLVDMTNCFPWGVDAAQNPSHHRTPQELTLEVKLLFTPVLALSVRFFSVLPHHLFILKLAYSHPVQEAFRN